MATVIGELAVRRSIVVDAPPERVWREFTSAERMERWFDCRRLTLEPWPGGHFEIEGDHGEIHFVFGGDVLVWDPPRELTVEWGWIPPRWPAPSVLTFLLRLGDGGGTHVEIVHHGFERIGERGREIYEGFESGWDLSELEALKGVVESA